MSIEFPPVEVPTHVHALRAEVREFVARECGAIPAVRRANCGSSNYAIYQMPASACSPPTARPGTSMHEQGLAIDFTLPDLVEQLAPTMAAEQLTALRAALDAKDAAAVACDTTLPRQSVSEPTGFDFNGSRWSTST